jgi:hypothetical protein
MKKRKLTKADRAEFIARADRWLKKQKDPTGHPWQVIDAAAAFLKFLPGRELTEIYNTAWKWFSRGVVPQRNYRTLLAPHFPGCPLFK